MKSLELETGRLIDRRYRVICLLGRGGMGAVYLALDEQSGRQIALKVMRLDPGSPDLAGRFLRGARLSRRVRHPHVIPTMSMGQWGDPVEGHYTVMQYFDALSLVDILDVGLSPGASCTLMCQVLSALAHVHALGVLHRDIKPENIMVSRLSDGSLHTKLTDFGIAASLSQDMNVTEDGSGVMVGTPAYMAPEQVQQCGVYAPALDLYAVGTTLYRLLSGKLPFAKSGMALLVARVTTEPMRLAPRDGESLPSDLCNLVMRLLSRRPEDRPAMAADVVRALKPFCEPAVLSATTWSHLVSQQEREHSAVAIEPTLTDSSGAGDTLIEANSGGTKVGRAHHSPSAKLWGRSAFLEGFTPLVKRAEMGDIQLAMLSGPVGIGKSSVMEALAFKLAKEGRFIALRTAYNANGGPSSGLKHAFDTYLGTVGRSADTVRDAVTEFLRRYDDVDAREIQDMTDFLRPRASADNAGELSGFGVNIALVIRMLRRISAVKPVMLVLDSLDQGGLEVLSFISQLIFESRFSPFPLLCMGAYSDGLGDGAFVQGMNKRDWSDGESFYAFEVPPVSEEAIVEGIAASGQLGVRTAEQIAQRAQGNPLFAMHLARAGGSVDREETKGTSTNPDTADLPARLARVLKLSMDESLAQTTMGDLLREVCRCVAVLGNRVRVDLLTRYAAAEGLQLDLEAALDPLIDLGLLVEGPLQAQDTVSLQPALMREMLLSETGPRRLRKMQKRAAETRSAWAESNLEQEAGAIADHYQAAGDLEQAVDWWVRSMPYEARSGQPGAAVRAGLKALAHIPAEEPQHSEVALITGQLLLDMGELEDAAQVLQSVVDMATADTAMVAGDLLADVFENSGQVTEWGAVIDAMSAREGECGPRGLRALFCARSMWLNSRGHRQQGFDEAKKAVDIAQPGPEAQRAAQRLVYTCLSRGELDIGERAARDALLHAGERPELKARSLRALGIVLVWKQRGAEAIAHFEELITLARRYGFNARLPIAWHDLGEALRTSGQVANAREAYQKAYSTARSMRLLSAAELIRPKLFICDLLEQRFDGVNEAIERFIPDALATGLALAEPFGRMLQAWAYALSGDVPSLRRAYTRVPSMRDMAIDPQFPLMMEQIGAAFATSDTPECRAHAVEALTLASEFWGRYGQAERSAFCLQKASSL